LILPFKSLNSFIFHEYSIISIFDTFYRVV
jgi:hypothetical protein